MAKIEVKNLYKIFGSNPQMALKKAKDGMSKSELLETTGHTIGIHDASFGVEEGEIFVVMGLSGSGKSTLIRCLNRLIESTAGEIMIDGVDVNALGSDELRKLRRKKTGMVFQRFALFPHRNVLQNAAYGLEIQGVEKSEREERALSVLDSVGLGEYSYVSPQQLSGGMQQRVGLARALSIDPDILLMDEPFSALDPLIRHDMQEELVQLQEEVQKTIVFITHDLDEALKLGDRIAIMKDGKIVQIGTPESILTEPADDYVKSFVYDVDRSRVLTAEHVMSDPGALVRKSEGPRVALRRMREKGFSSIFVVEKERKLVGIVTADKAVEAVKNQKNDLADIIDTDIPTTSPDTLIQDLIPMAVEAKVPIAVVDENNRLQGIMVRVSVLSGMLRKVDEE